jgi:hypothetical protein
MRTRSEASEPIAAAPAPIHGTNYGNPVDNHGRAFPVRNERQASAPTAEIHPLFAVHLLNEEGLNNATAIALAFSRLVEDLEGLVPASSELSIALTHLQTACFHAKRGMAESIENQQK